MMRLTVVGAGLAGSEAALQAAARGVRVRLVEMRPGTMTPAHRTGEVAELVCSNSLKSDEPGNAHGLLKAELRILGSRLLDCAERARVPGGKALVVDRERFSAAVAEELERAGVELVREEVTTLPGGPAIIAAGPLLSDALAGALEAALGAGRLFFFDAIAPVVSAESLDPGVVFRGSRYGAGEDYLNCPMTRDEYERFVAELASAETAPVRDFETTALFEGCLPVEELARRGPDTLAFGPMKPVGLVDPRTGQRPHAVVQLRQENAEGTMFNLVGFQTRLKQAEQRRVFRMIPGLANAGFLRYGAMHRNSYLDGPRVLLPTLQCRARPDLFVGGQLTGVEGYVESIGAGLVAGINAARLMLGDRPVEVPAEMMLGSLLRYVSAPCSGQYVRSGSGSPIRNGKPTADIGLGRNPDRRHVGLCPAPEDRMPVMSLTRGACPSYRFQPMNANFGLLPPVAGVKGRRQRREAQVERALAAIAGFAGQVGPARGD
ncbi:methylenetetrahydrofolate--tRNA-(uracil(54)-C(5))-methyltransferase (FADH(2)-oxidizing) TrmFO [candidate division WOR-3 bacterium]|nr:methylenetetrahydrofolate--tRNA-(uracil(54)-C(5))-methyltransferase (FADH(2)-oxidizing) TrmFO [candidate division WOR-3 bacterium]